MHRARNTMGEPIKARFLADLQGKREEETISKYNNVSPGRKQIPITTTTPECFITRFKAPLQLLITNTKHLESAEREIGSIPPVLMNGRSSNFSPS
ncbi:hypothetical protein TNCT_209751 [Trichonephila clavata]|uniref:Uncharacterized protein n=1 Tax=Trichonephila clavata TaxID=2740835 RepID=A0A8X6GDR3_TRICU|nr:hypothetical protein TNCT_209751 [Trichonephila clavata]